MKHLLTSIICFFFIIKGNAQFLNYINIPESELVAIAKKGYKPNIQTDNSGRKTISWIDTIDKCKIVAEINPLSEHPLNVDYIPYTANSLKHFIEELNKNFRRVTENMWEELGSAKYKIVIMKGTNTDKTEYDFYFSHIADQK